MATQPGTKPQEIQYEKQRPLFASGGLAPTLFFPPVEQKTTEDLNRKLSILVAISSTRCEAVGHSQEILDAERAKSSMGRPGGRNPIKGNTEQTVQ